MKPAFAHLAPTVPVTFAAAMGIALSVFMLPGAGVQGEPTPLLAVIGGAAGRVAADLPAPVNHRAPEPVTRAVVPARPPATRSERFAPRRHAEARTHRVHRHTRSQVVRATPTVPVQTAAPPAPATAMTTRRLLDNSKSAKSKSHGHGHARALQPTARTRAPSARGRGKAKALGHSSEHHSALSPGQAKKAPAAPAPAPTTSPKANRGGNEHDRNGK
jgi:hypothetical protein